MLLQIVTSFLKKHKNTVYFMFLFFGIFALSTHGVFAETTQGTGITKEDSDQIIKYMNMALKAAAAILGLVTSFISIFLYPGWVNGTMFGLQDYLKEIWILVSNVVYFIFAGILITIAFMNIIGKGDGNWELKQAMPKFIIGVLIVPFSWFMVQFLLSLSAILTVGVLTLPYNSFQNEALFQGAMANSELADQKFCKDIIINFTDQPVGTAITEGDENFSENIECESEESKVSIKDIISGEGNAEGLNNGVFGIISVYTYGILRVQELDTIVGADLNTVKGISDLVFKIVFDFLFVIVYLLLMVALFLALMVRGVRLWVFMMLSPVFGLLYFLGKTDGGGGDLGKKFSPKEFVALALVPVYVAAALAFGLTFIMVASEGIKQQSSSQDMDKLEAGGFSISIVGAHADGEEEKSVIAKLIVELFGVVVLWIAVMAALKQSETTGAIIAPIASFGESVGKLVAAAPTYAPIIPTGNGGAMSITGLQQVGSSISSKFQTSAQNKGTEFAKTLPGMNADGSIDLSQKSINALTYFNNNDKNLNTDSVKELKDAITNGGDIKTLSRHPDFLKTINTIVENDPLFKDIKGKGKITSGDEIGLANLISEMDYVLDKDRPSLLNGGLLSDSKKGTVSIDNVDKRIKGLNTDNQPIDENITNNFNVRVDGKDFTEPKAVLDKLGANNIDELNTKMSTANIPEKFQAAIREVFNAGKELTDGE